MGRPRIPAPIGQRFNMLTVIADANTPENTRSRWICRCDCGTEKSIMSKLVLNGLTKSCGCLKEPHGGVGRPEYLVWQGMRQRCRWTKGRGYKNYGGRGIGVDTRWDDFAVFLADVGPRPSPEHTLDRIDNARGYEPGNVRWATMAEQARNKRTNRWITFGGRTMLLSDWAKELGIEVPPLLRRLRDWPLEKALTVPRVPREDAHRKASVAARRRSDTT